MTGHNGAGPQKRITLPSSGLAEEILGGNLAAQAAPSGGESSSVVARTAQTAAPVGSLHLVGLWLNTEEYALDISQVHEIIRVGGWTHVPNSPPHVKGVINLRGRIIPVIDLKVRMGLKEAELTKDARIMIVETGGKMLGVLVDGVSQVFRLPLDSVEVPPEEAAEEGATEKGYIKGVGKIEGRLIILLDLAKTIGREGKSVVNEQSHGEGKGNV